MGLQGVAVAALALALHSVACQGLPGKVEPYEEQAIKTFMTDYEKDFASFQKYADDAAKLLQAKVDNPDFMVPPEISHRAKAPDSLRKKLYERATEKDYKTVQDIKDDIADIIGLRITTFTPSVDIPLVEGILNSSFTMTDWRRADESAKYSGNNYRALINNAKVEIQVRGCLDHAFLQLDHKVAYKPKPGYALDPEQKAAFEAMSASVKAAKASLASFVKLFRAHHHAKGTGSATGNDQAKAQHFREMVSTVNSIDRESEWITLHSAAEEEVWEAASAEADARATAAAAKESHVTAHSSADRSARAEMGAPRASGRKMRRY